MGACGHQQFVIAKFLVPVQDQDMVRGPQSDGFPAPHPFHVIDLIKIRFGEIEPLQRPLPRQVLMQDASGIDMFILGNEDDLPLFVVFAKLSDGVDTCGR